MKVIFILWLIVILNIFGCSPLPNSNSHKTNKIPIVEQTKDMDEFSILVKDNTISLKAWDSSISLNDLLGKPISEKTEILGNSSDIFQGSFIRELKYEGLIIKLFSPKDNGDTFYIIGIKTTVDYYKSARGIKVGDRSEQLKIQYPDISVVEDGRTDSDNCAYQFTRDNQNYIIFEVKDAKITEINIYHEAP